MFSQQLISAYKSCLKLQRLQNISSKKSSKSAECHVCEEFVCDSCAEKSKCKTCGFLICKECEFDEDIRQEYLERQAIFSCEACTENKYNWKKKTNPIQCLPVH